MENFYNILLIAGVLISVVFVLLVFVTGKGDAMSGGAGGVRTTFKGKASFEDKMSRITMILGISFVSLCIILDVIAHRADLK